MPRGTSDPKPHRMVGRTGVDPRDLVPLDYDMGDATRPEPDLWAERKGTYLPSQVRDEDGVITRRTAYVCCAVCGKWSSLWEFDIDASGLVDPPMRCPHCRYVMRPRLSLWRDIDWTKGQGEKKVALLSDGAGTKHGP